MNTVYMQTNAAHDMGMKIKVLRNRMQDINQDCDGAAKK